MNKSRSRGIFFIVAIIWGVSYAVQKPLLERIDPVTFTFWSFLLSGIVFLVYALYKKINLLYRLQEGVLLGIFLSLVEILEMVGLKLTSSANTVFLANIGMLMIPYVSFLLFRTKTKMLDALAVLLASFGMYLLVGGVNGFSLGDGIVLISSLASAFYFIYSERYEHERSSHITSLCIQQFFTIALISFLWHLFTGISLTVPQDLHVTLLWQTALFITLPYAVIQFASRFADEMVAAIYDGVVEPLAGAITSWVIFKESTTFVQIIGGGIMVVAFMVTAIVSRRHFIYTFVTRTVRSIKK